MDISIMQAALHILDPNSGVPVLSQAELEFDQEITEFIIKHTEKLYQDPAAKTADFLENSKFKQLLLSHEEFLPLSCAIASRLFDLLRKYCEIPSADLFIAMLKIDGAEYMAVYKLNYKESYTHQIHHEDAGVSNQIMKYRTLFPGENQRIDEGALIAVDGGRLRLVEKAYPIDGVKENYFSSKFLECSTELSPKETIRAIKKAASKISDKYNNDELDTITKMKTAVADFGSSEETIPIEQFSKEIFSESAMAQEEYVALVKEAGVCNAPVMDEAFVQRSVGSHRIKTDTGVELKFPVAMYHNKDLIEFVNNPDGTTSILIKNITKMINR